MFVSPPQALADAAEIEDEETFGGQEAINDADMEARAGQSSLGAE